MNDPLPQGAEDPALPDAAPIPWHDIDAALSPVIGQRGVAALYKRSLHLTRGAHPCLQPAYESAQRPGDFAALKAALSQPAGPATAAANRALLQTFTDLLAQLIGRTLSARLLEPVWTPPPSSSGPAAQDTPP